MLAFFVPELNANVFLRNETSSCTRFSSIPHLGVGVEGGGMVAVHARGLIIRLFQMLFGTLPGDKGQGQRPGDEPPDESSTSGELMTTEDISQYYVSLKHFVNILKKKYGLDIAAPNYKKMDRRDKIVLMSALIKALKKSWRKVKPYQ